MHVAVFGDHLQVRSRKSPEVRRCPSGAGEPARPGWSGWGVRCARRGVMCWSRSRNVPMEEAVVPATPKAASAFIVEQQRSLRESLPLDDTRDFIDADRGFIDTLEPGVIHAEDGRVVWDCDSYDFLTGDAPDSVNPSLWRQPSLVAKHGLFEVVEGIYQVRGFDLSNTTFVEGDTGVVVLDPLLTAE